MVLWAIINSSNLSKNFLIFMLICSCLCRVTFSNSCISHDIRVCMPFNYVIVQFLFVPNILTHSLSLFLIVNCLVHCVLFSRLCVISSLLSMLAYLVGLILNPSAYAQLWGPSVIGCLQCYHIASITNYKIMHTGGCILTILVLW